MSYAYCSDTVFNPKVAESIKNTTTIYHEATYTNDYAVKARERGHTTASEAANIAKLANAETLILGHFSKRYINEEQHLKEAQVIFPNTILANEGLKIDLL